MEPNKPCAKPGCPALAITGERYCEKHLQSEKKRQQELAKKRKTSCKRGYGRAWQKYRLGFLAKHPLCMRCCEIKGRIVLATVVDHIQPHKGDMVSFWDKTNHQGLCKRCHDKKTASEDGGFGL